MDCPGRVCVEQEHATNSSCCFPFRACPDPEARPCFPSRPGSPCARRAAPASCCQPENEVSWLVWSLQCSLPERTGPGNFLCLPLPRSLRKMDYSMTLYARQQKRHRYKEQTFGLCGRRRGWDELRIALKHVYYHM